MLRYRPEIDGLRALAVLPVVLFHANVVGFTGGFVGVDVFFVISGFLITTLLSEQIRTNSYSAVHFYIKRARRLAPAVFLVVFSCVPFAIAWFTPSDLKDFGQSVVAVISFSSNFLFWWEEDYFAAASELKPLLHTWSLAIEEQFYFIFPPLLLLISGSRLTVKLSVLAPLALVSFGLACWMSYSHPSASFYLLPTRIWELLVGVMLATWSNGSSRGNVIVASAGLVAMTGSMALFSESTPYPSQYTLIPTLGAAAVLYGAHPSNFVGRALASPLLVTIGLMSYSIYLWHQPVLAFANYRLPHQTSGINLTLLLTLVGVLSYLSWQFVEKPFRDARVIGNRIFFAALATSALIGFLIFAHLQSTNGLESRANFSTSLEQSLKRIEPSGCFDIPYNHEAADWGCRLGSNKQHPEVFLIGDSHALSVMPVLDKIGREEDLSIFFTGSSGCIPLLGAHPDRADQTVNNCAQLNERVLDYASTKRPIVIILVARWSYYTVGGYNGAPQLIALNKAGPFNKDSSESAFVNSFQKTVKAYRDLGIPLIVVSQVPQQLESAEKLYFKVNNGTATIEELSVRLQLFRKIESPSTKLFLSALPPTHVIDTKSVFCDALKCYFGTSDFSYYYDDDHLSIEGSMVLEPELKGALSTLMEATKVL